MLRGRANSCRRVTAKIGLWPIALCAETDRVLIAAFSLSSDAAPAAAVKSPGFWSKLHRGEHLVAAINQYLSNTQLIHSQEKLT